MKDIKSCLEKIERTETAVENIGKFLKTKKGQQFVSKLHTASIRELRDRYKAPRFLRIFDDDRKNKNLILAAINKYNISIPKYTPITTTKVTITKTSIRLTKKELREIDAQRPRRTGRAALMHSYEEHKMAKFIAVHPIPTETDLKQDLFPEELKKAHDELLEKHREYVRKFIVSTYYKLPIIGRYKIADGVFVNRPIMEIKDICMGGHNINGIPKTHPLLKKVQKIVDECYSKDNSLVCIIIRGHSKQGRIMIPTKYNAR